MRARVVSRGDLVSKGSMGMCRAITISSGLPLVSLCCQPVYMKTERSTDVSRLHRASYVPYAPSGLHEVVFHCYQAIPSHLYDIISSERFVRVALQSIELDNPKSQETIFETFES